MNKVYYTAPSFKNRLKILYKYIPTNEAEIPPKDGIFRNL